jgi:hypothetical protein
MTGPELRRWIAVKSGGIEYPTSMIETYAFSLGIWDVNFC